jgi:hypothetical protein
MRASWLATLTACALTAAATDAGAVVVSEDPLAGESFEVGAALRSYELVLSGGPLVGPFATPGANPAALSLVSVRPKLELRRQSFEVIVHDELTSSASTLPLGELGGALPIADGARTPSFLPLDWSAIDHVSFSLYDRLDWLYARFTAGAFAFTVGRQPLTLGRGKLWTPEDLLAPFRPLALNTEYKPGVDAARLDWSLGDGASLLLLGSLGTTTQRSFHADRTGSAALVRGELALGRLRLGAQGGLVHGDTVGALDFFVDLPHGADLHGVGTLALVGDAARRPYARRGFTRALLGGSFEPLAHVLATAELYYSGSGGRAPDDYWAGFESARFSSGESPNVGRLYAGLACAWQAHALLAVNGSLLSNLEDGSFLLGPGLDYSLAQNTQIMAGALVAFGRGVRARDGAPEAGSEFGSYPDVYHFDIKLYF